MERNAEKYLTQWLHSKNRKPLVMRGARQVGKTWLVRRTAKANGLDLVEINFEQDSAVKQLFASNETSEYLSLLEIETGKRIEPGKSLLFLDEIQAFPEMLAKLRWFYEQLPELPVVTAGSLLDFALDNHSFSMPVGRIGYFFLEPLGFREFLAGAGHAKMVAFLDSISMDQIRSKTPINPAIHQKITSLFKTYALTGGMPEAADAWFNTKSYLAVSEIQHNLLMTFRDDFAKYAGRQNLDILDAVFREIPRTLGTVVKYSRLAENSRTEPVKKAFELLTKARVCHKICSVSADGIPLGATVNPKKFKALFLDAGLVSAALGLYLNSGNMTHDLTLVNSGAIAEQLAGQLIRTTQPFFVDPSLYFWQRNKPGAEAEVDFILQHGQRIVPIEVKAGSTGAMKSLHSLMTAKRLPFAVRLNSDQPSLTHVSHGLHDGSRTDYQLLSLPLYMTEQIPRLIEAVEKN